MRANLFSKILITVNLFCWASSHKITITQCQDTKLNAANLKFYNGESRQIDLEIPDARFAEYIRKDKFENANESQYWYRLTGISELKFQVKGDVKTKWNYFKSVKKNNYRVYFNVNQMSVPEGQRKLETHQLLQLVDYFCVETVPYLYMNRNETAVFCCFFDMHERLV